MKIEVGTKIGKLTIIELIHQRKVSSKSGKVYYKAVARCNCDCGTIDFICDTCNLRAIKDKAGCGCNRGRSKFGFGRKISSNIKIGKYFSQQFLNRAKKKTSTRRKGNGIKFTLTVEQLDIQYEKQNGLCYYTGQPLKLPDMTLSYTANACNKNISIDRIDSKKDYTVDNIVLCTIDANLAKQQLSVEQFLTLCRQVVLTHG